MTDSKNLEDWEELVTRLEAADAECTRAQGVVTSKFSAIAKRVSTENPSTKEMDDLESAWEKRDDIRNESKRFLRDRGLL